MYICIVMMKKTLLSLTALAAALTLSAQEIRTNYRSEGLTHISTEAEPCQDFTVRSYTSTSARKPVSRPRRA